MTKSSIRILDECIQHAIAIIFKAYDKDNIAVIRVPYNGILTERRRLKFVNRLLDSGGSRGRGYAPRWRPKTVFFACTISR